MNWIAKKNINKEFTNALIDQCVEENIFTNGGAKVKLLEDFIKKKFLIDDTKCVIVVVNGSVALHSLSSGICYFEKKNIKWATQSFTFPPSVQGNLINTKILDIDHDCGLNLELVDDNINGLIITNIFGNCVDISKYENYCKKYNKYLIFDNAATPYTFYKNKNVLNYGIGCIISFHHTKPFGFGEGGAIIVDKCYEKNIRCLNNFGIGLTDQYWIPEGNNNKMSEISAIYIYQYLYSNFNTIIKKHTELYTYFKKKLIKNNIINFKLFPSYADSAVVSCICVLFDNYDDNIRIKLLENNIQVRKYYHPLDDSQMATRIYNNILCIPCNIDITKQDIDRIFKILTSAPAADVPRMLGAAANEPSDVKRICNLIKFENEIHIKYQKHALTSHKNIEEICRLKNSFWKYGMTSQINFINKTCNDNDNHCMVYVQNVFAGYCLYRMIRRDLFIIDSVIVRDNYRKGGIGSYMLNNLINKNGNYNKYVLICENEKINFYNKFGFEKSINITINDKKIKPIQNIMVKNINVNQKDCFYYFNGPIRPRVILITGGAGFIASHVTLRLVERYPHYKIVVLDKLDYCSSLKNLDAVQDMPNFRFVKGNILSSDLVTNLLETEKVDTIMHFAAQTHVDNSFGNSFAFTENNIMGTHVLVEAAKRLMLKCPGRLQRFVHVSTDEVYGEGDIDQDQAESTGMNPTNPYAATKAGAELIAKAYFRSFKLPLIITRGNNVYGPHQYPEKIIPKFINLLMRGRPLPIHGNGSNTRNYLFVDDCAAAFDTILHHGSVGKVYNIGSSNEMANIDVARSLIKVFGLSNRADELMHFVADRCFNDLRYPINSTRLLALGWREETAWDAGLARTVAWYKEHAVAHWVQNIESALVPHPRRQ